MEHPPVQGACDSDVHIIYLHPLTGATANIAFGCDHAGVQHASSMRRSDQGIPCLGRHRAKKFTGLGNPRANGGGGATAG